MMMPDEAYLLITLLKKKCVHCLEKVDFFFFFFLISTTLLSEQNIYVHK